MTQEERDLIHKDACGRIPYKPYAAYEFEGELIQVQITGMDGDEPTSPFYGYSFDTWGHIPHDNVKLYLRPMSSMTEEEMKEHDKQICKDDEYLRKTFESPYACTVGLYELDWLNSHYLDYRDLIGKGLALVAPKEMYKI